MIRSAHIVRGATSKLAVRVSDRQPSAPATCPPVFTQISKNQAAQVTSAARTVTPASASARTDSRIVTPVVNTSSMSTTSAFAGKRTPGGRVVATMIRPCRLCWRSRCPRPTESRTPGRMRNRRTSRQPGSQLAATTPERATGSPPRRRAAVRRVGAGTSASGRVVSRNRSSPLAIANPKGFVRSHRQCSLTASTAARGAPRYAPSAQQGTPGSALGRMRIGGPDKASAHRAHQAVPARPHPPHARGRIRSSSSPMPPVCA